MPASLVFKNLFILILLLFGGSTITNAALPYFVADTNEHSQMIQTAFKDAITLARTVALRWNPSCDPYLDRYFTPKYTTFVEQLFRNIADIPLDLDLDNTDEVKKFLASLKPEQLNDKFKGISISYGDSTVIPPSQWATVPWTKCDQPGNYGSLWILKADITRSYMSLCPRLFQTFYSLSDVENPPAALTQKGIPGLGCYGLGDTETNYVMTPGHAALHELFHFTYLLSDITDFAKNIRSDPNTGQRISDYEKSLRPDVLLGPVNGYGAFYAHKVRNLRDKPITGFNEAINNADSYAIYATMRYWGLTCNKDFKPAVNQASWRVRQNVPELAAKLANVQEEDSDPDSDPVGCWTTPTSDWVVCS